MFNTGWDFLLGSLEVEDKAEVGNGGFGPCEDDDDDGVDSMTPQDPLEDKDVEVYEKILVVLDWILPPKTNVNQLLMETRGTRILLDRQSLNN